MTGNEGSFDPHTWLAGSIPPAEPSRPDVAGLPENSKAKTSTSRMGARGIAVAGGATVAIAAVIAVLVWHPASTPSTPAVVGSTTATGTAVTTTPNREPPPLSRRTLLLDSAAKLRGALDSTGIAVGEADTVAQLAARALGGGAGPLHTAISLDSRAAKPSLVRLEASYDDSSGAIVARQGDGSFTVSKVAARLSTKINVVRGEMDAESFYSSAVAAGIADTLVPDIAKSLAFDFDFQREIHPGDVFEIAWEQEVNAQGQAFGVPRLRYVSMTTKEKSRTIYWFQPKGGQGGWFDGNGTSVVRSLMRTPVDGARISSTFGPRMHPVLGFMKLHEGTDFAAPIGTPIYASGDATVEWAAMKGANNGNLTILHHDNGWQTYYLHQSRYADGIAPGARVKQGQLIGYIGTTGRSTGPHLHYGLKIDGQFTDPQAVKTEATKKLDGAVLDHFIAERDRIDVNRARVAS